MTEVEIHVEVPNGNETSQVFPPDTLKVSMVKEKGSKGSKDNVEEESGSDSLKVSNCDNLKVSQSKCHVKGGKQMAKFGVAK
eukprot:11085311-Ditylum_brightwellii.AAC.1